MQLTFFTLRININRYSEARSTKYRPISNTDHFSSRSIKIGNRFQPTACQGCTRKAFTIMSAEKHHQWNVAFSARMKSSIINGQHTKHCKIKPCVYHICNSPSTLAQQTLHSNSLRSVFRFTLTLRKSRAPTPSPSQDTCIVPEAPPAFKSQPRLMQIRSPHTGLSSEMLPIRYH